MHDAPLLVLALAGALSTVAYALLITLPLRLDLHPPSRTFDLARAIGADGSGLARFVLTMALLFGLYLLAVPAARRAGRRGAWLALGLAAAMMLALLPAHPWYSRDVYHYIASMRVLYTHGHNPYLVPPDAVSGDSLMALADWSWLPSPYGPVWTLLTAIPAATGLFAESATAYLLAFKVLAAACALGAAWLAGASAERLRPGTRTLGVVLVAWNPLMVLHSAGDAHNDAVMLLFVAAAIHLVLRERVALAGWVLAGGALVKFVPVVLLPLLLAASLRTGGRHRWREAAITLLAFPIAATLTYLPFWEGWRTVQPSLEEGSYLTTSPQAALAVLFTGSLPGEMVGSLVSVASRLLFLPVFVFVLWRVRGRADVPGQGAVLLLGWLAVASPWFMPWYALWPLVLAAASPWRREVLALVLALTVGALLLPAVTGYLMPMSGQGRDWPLLHLLGVAVVWGPVVLVGAALWWQWRAWTEAGASSSVTTSRAPAAGDAGD